MKQLSAMGNRRHYYRNSSRMSMVDAQQQQQPSTVHSGQSQRPHGAIQTDPISISLNHFNDPSRPAPTLNPNDPNFANLDFFGQSNFNEFMIQNERIGYPHANHNSMHNMYHADTSGLLNPTTGTIHNCTIYHTHAHIVANKSINFCLLFV
jgi:hypothetical protein